MPTQIQPNTAAGRVAQQREVVRRGLQQRAAALEALTTEWDALTAAAKQEVTRQAVILCLRTVKYLYDKLDG